MIHNCFCKKCTYLEIRAWSDCNLSNLPDISTITRPKPHWHARFTRWWLHVHIKCANVLAIHVVPELEALASLNSRVSGANKPCFVTLFPWRRCLDVHVIPYKQNRKKKEKYIKVITWNHDYMRGGFIPRTRQNVPWIEVSKRNFPNIYKRLYEKVRSLSRTWWPFQHLISSLLWSCYVCFGNAWKGTYHRNGVRLKHSTKPLLLSALFWIFFFLYVTKKNQLCEKLLPLLLSIIADGPVNVRE